MEKDKLNNMKIKLIFELTGDFKRCIFFLVSKTVFNFTSVLHISRVL